MGRRGSEPRGVRNEVKRKESIKSAMKGASDAIRDTWKDRKLRPGKAKKKVTALVTGRDKDNQEALERRQDPLAPTTATATTQRKPRPAMTQSNRRRSETPKRSAM